VEVAGSRLPSLFLSGLEVMLYIQYIYHNVSVYPLLKNCIMQIVINAELGKIDGISQLVENFGKRVQCCGSGMFYPGSDHCSIPDPDPGSGG
jgi:hypothetical protein